MKRFHHLVAAATCAFATTIAPAAVQIVNKDGKLTGATGVTVLDQTYDVTFVDGTCASVYGSCATDSFDFTKSSVAEAAGKALGDQVFRDTTLGKFNSDPTLTLGCSNSFACETFLVFSAVEGGVNAVTYQNLTAPYTDRTGLTSFGLTADSSSNPGINYVRFSLVQTGGSAAPEPASWAMMIGGFGMVGAALRRRRRTSLRFV